MPPMTLEQYVGGWAKRAGLTGAREIAEHIGWTESGMRAAFRRGYCSRRMADDLERVSDGALKAQKLLIGFARESG